MTAGEKDSNTKPTEGENSVKFVVDGVTMEFASVKEATEWLVAHYMLTQ